MLFAFILAFVCMLSVVYGDTIHVPGDYPTIQKAIDAAVNGDTVLVAPNTYYESIDFSGKDITVTSEGGSGATILDAIGVGSVVTFNNEETSDAVLDGFTIRNGSGTYHNGFYFGGGIFIRGASPCIINCIIQDNLFTGDGGGISILGGHSSSFTTSPTITNCIIKNNTALKGAIGGGGGGILIRSLINNSNVLIHKCVIEDNFAGDYGGGIIVEQLSSCEISDCKIRNNETINRGGGIFLNSYENYYTHIFDSHINNNSVLKSGHGAGIAIYGHYVDIHDNRFFNNCILTGGYGAGIAIKNQYFHIENNLVYDNYSINNGGGVSLVGVNKIYSPQIFLNNKIFNNTSGNIGGGIHFAGVDMEFINYTITGNTAALGGGIGVCGNSSIFMANSILWDNEATTSDNEVYVESGSTATIIYSDVEGGYIGTSNIDADPSFVDIADNDFHLTYNSPCMNTGVNSAVIETEDFDGNPRICNGRVDMGFDEFYTHLYVTGDKTPGGSIEGKLVGIPGTTPVGLFIGSGVLPSPLPTEWGDFYLQSPLILFVLIPIPADGFLVLPATLPASIPPPYDIPMQALIGLNPDSLTSLCVLEVR